MTRQLLGGAAVAALIIVSATGARANPLNTFSNNDTTTITSGASAVTGDGGDGGNANGGNANGGSGHPQEKDALWTGGSESSGDPGQGGAGGAGGAGGTGGGTATATSESYNTEQEGVSNQTLNGSVTGNTLTADWDYESNGTSGNANVGGDAGIAGFSNAAGVNIASANTGAQALNQQAVSLGIVGTVNLNHN